MTDPLPARCRVCRTPVLPTTGNVCLVCRPAFDAGRRVGMEYAIAMVIQQSRDEWAGWARLLVTGLRGAMPSARRSSAHLPDMPTSPSGPRPRKLPSTHHVRLVPQRLTSAGDHCLNGEGGCTAEAACPCGCRECVGARGGS